LVTACCCDRALPEHSQGMRATACLRTAHVMPLHVRVRGDRRARLCLSTSMWLPTTCPCRLHCLKVCVKVAYAPWQAAYGRARHQGRIRASNLLSHECPCAAPGSMRRPWVHPPTECLEIPPPAVTKSTVRGSTSCNLCQDQDQRSRVVADRHPLPRRTCPWRSSSRGSRSPGSPS
jgi:hypothetical protein